MPYSVKHSDDCPAERPWAVMNDQSGDMVACHATEGSAMAQVKALYANEGGPAVKVCKVDTEQQLVFGWASVSSDGNGRLVVDSDGEMIEPHELEQAVYDYVLEAREAGG